MTTRVLAFDIGIKNLAFCIMDASNVVHRLENCNIIAPVVRTKCASVTASAAPCICDASFIANSKHYCKKHIPKTFVIVEKKQHIGDLKKIAKTMNIKTVKKSKDDILTLLSGTHAFPFTQPKQAKASALGLTELHDALIKFVDEYWADFSKCTHVLLENQPAFKNPHMKSVQVLLFAVLRERFVRAQNIVPFHLVHASRKTKGSAKEISAGDEGYSDRKAFSEDKVTSLFEKSIISPQSIYDEWKKSKKRSDMADAVCMCMDFVLSL